MGFIYSMGILDEMAEKKIKESLPVEQKFSGGYRILIIRGF